MAQILITGAGGMLGQALRSEFPSAIALERTDLDVSNPVAVARLLEKPYGEIGWIVNAAAFTGVDLAETERQSAYEANALGPGYLAQVALVVGARLVHVSTDYVFDGGSERPYEPDDPPAPQSWYGETKWRGEQAVLSNGGTVVRTSWLFGPGGKSFPRTIWRAYRAGRALQVVADQFGTPTYTPELARMLREACEANIPTGVYHAAGPEIVSWCDLARLVVESAGGDPADVKSITTSDWPTPAPRPKYSALCSRALLALGVTPHRNLADCVRQFVTDLDTDTE